MAGRGEIARRIMRTLRRLEIRSVAAYSEADAGLPFVQEADEAVLLGPADPRQSYLDGERLIEAARRYRRAGRPPLLRLPVRIGGVRRAGHRRRAGLDRPTAGRDGRDGRQDRGPAHHGRCRRAGRGRDRPAGHRRRRRPGRRRAPRLPADGQGERRRGRHRHGCGARRRVAALGVHQRPEPGRAALRLGRHPARALPDRAPGTSRCRSSA